VPDKNILLNKSKKVTKKEDMRESRSLYNEIEILKEYFQKLWKRGKPLAMLFSTDSRFYLYDTGSNKILVCNEIVFKLLDKFLSSDIEYSISEFILKNGRERFIYAAETIKNEIEKENILVTKKAERFDLSEHFRNYKEI